MGLKEERKKKFVDKKVRDRDRYIEREIKCKREKV